MEKSGNPPDKKASNQRKIWSLAKPQDMEKCKGCSYPGVGFICWSQDGSCMKTDAEKISSRSRR